MLDGRVRNSNGGQLLKTVKTSGVVHLEAEEEEAK